VNGFEAYRVLMIKRDLSAEEIDGLIDEMSDSYRSALSLWAREDLSESQRDRLIDKVNEEDDAYYVLCNCEWLSESQRGRLIDKIKDIWFFTVRINREVAL
jgi:hypothetical protein